MYVFISTNCSKVDASWPIIKPLKLPHNVRCQFFFKFHGCLFRDWSFSCDPLVPYQKALSFFIPGFVSKLARYTINAVNIIYAVAGKLILVLQMKINAKFTQTPIETPCNVLTFIIPSILSRPGKITDSLMFFFLNLSWVLLCQISHGLSNWLVLSINWCFVSFSFSRSYIPKVHYGSVRVIKGTR